VFIAIMIATILKGIIGALLVVPLLASIVVVGDYIRRQVAGLPPFEDDGSRRFVAPPDKVNPSRRRWTNQERRQHLDKTSPALPGTVQDAPESDVSEPAAPLMVESQSKQFPVRQKTENIRPELDDEG
jgi:hypothetical protein